MRRQATIYKVGPILSQFLRRILYYQPLIYIPIRTCYFVADSRITLNRSTLRPHAHLSKTWRTMSCW